MTAPKQKIRDQRTKEKKHKKKKEPRGADDVHRVG